MARKYEYAVMDGNESPDQDRMAWSCHRTLEAAVRAAERANRGDPNARYYVIEWGGSWWARERAAPAHQAGLRLDLRKG